MMADGDGTEDTLVAVAVVIDHFLKQSCVLT